MSDQNDNERPKTVIARISTAAFDLIAGEVQFGESFADRLDKKLGLGGHDENGKDKKKDRKPKRNLVR